MCKLFKKEITNLTVYNIIKKYSVYFRFKKNSKSIHPSQQQNRSTCKYATG